MMVRVTADAAKNPPEPELSSVSGLKQLVTILFFSSRTSRTVSLDMKVLVRSLQHTLTLPM